MEAMSRLRGEGMSDGKAEVAAFKQVISEEN